MILEILIDQLHKNEDGIVDYVGQNYLDIYDETVFKARHQLITKGYYKTLIKEVKKIMNNHNINNKIILDCGCGEGTILEILKGNNTALGIDLSRDAIKFGSTQYLDIDFILADVNKLPFKDKSIDCIINIMSPYNYEEFARILKDDGILIKVIPNEMISAAANTYKSNAKERFYNELESNFKVLDNIEVDEVIEVDEEDQDALNDMNPPLWIVDELPKETNLTLDATIVVAQKN